MTDAELKDRVEAVLKSEVAPAFEIDGGAVEVLEVNEGVVRLRIGDACASCPASAMTLIMGLEQELRRRIPEVEYLEAVP